MAFSLTLLAVLTTPSTSQARLADSPDGTHQAATPCSPEWLRQGPRVQGVAEASALEADGGVMVGDDGVASASEVRGTGAPELSARAQPAADPPTPGDQTDPGQLGERVIPIDPQFALYQRNLKEIGAPEGWPVSYGGSDVTVAIVSSGMYLGHEDLRNKVWKNRGEIAFNGIDDDGNGYVDDVNGWNFAEDNNDVNDTHGGRGTMLAGIVAAETNNKKGVAGISWNARVMPLKVYRFEQRRNPDGSIARSFRGYPEKMAAAVCYAVQNGARVILLAGFLQNPAKQSAIINRLQDAIEYAHSQRVVVVADAGDCGVARKGYCPEQVPGDVNLPIIPAALDRVIGVQSYGLNYQEAKEASHGWWVDIAAPGEAFDEWFQMAYYNADSSTQQLYTWIQPSSHLTSDFAAAQVAGVVSVMLSANPLLLPNQVEQQLCMHANRRVFNDTQRSYDEFVQQGPYSWQRNDYWGCGILNVEHTLEQMPWKLHDLPDETIQLTSDAPPYPVLQVAYPYLNEGAWDLSSDVDWLIPEPVHQNMGEAAVVQLRADVEMLKASRGGNLQANSNYTATVRVCPHEHADEQAKFSGDWGDGCHDIRYTLKAAGHIFANFFPQLFSLKPR